MNDLAQLCLAYKGKSKESGKRRNFEMIFYLLGTKVEEVAAERIKMLPISDKIKQELLMRLREKFSHSDRPYMHAWSRSICDKLAACSNSTEEKKALVAIKNIIGSATNKRIINRIYDEVSEYMNLDRNEFILAVKDTTPFLKYTVNRKTEIAENKKSAMDAIHDQVYALCDYLGLEYVRQHKEQIGKYTFVVDAYISDLDAIIDVTSENNAKTSDTYKKIIWRKDQLRRRFKKCVFFEAKEVFKRPIALDRINSELGLGFRAMELID